MKGRGGEEIESTGLLMLMWISLGEIFGDLYLKNHLNYKLAKKSQASIASVRMIRTKFYSDVLSIYTCALNYYILILLAFSPPVVLDF